MPESHPTEPDLQAYLDRDPDFARTEQVEQHLRECSTCQRQAAWLRAVSAKLRDSEQTALPEGFHQRLAARLDRLEVPALPRRRTHWRAWAGGLSLAACLALACVTLLRSPDATDGVVADMVNHHQVCWNIPTSKGRQLHFQEWVKAHPGASIPIPLVASAGLQEQERRNCPVGEGARGPHMMYFDPAGRQVSLYALPRKDLSGLPPLPEQLEARRYGNHTVLVWQRGEWAYGLVAESGESEMRKWVDPAVALEDPGAVAQALLIQLRPAG